MTATSQHRTLEEHRAYVRSVKYNHDKQVVEWGLDVEEHYYTKQSVKNLIEFLCWRVDENWFYLTVNRREFKVQVTHNGFLPYAKTDQYSDPEDYCNVAFTRQCALEGLIEKLQMAIEEGRI